MWTAVFVRPGSLVKHVFGLQTVLGNVESRITAHLRILRVEILILPVFNSDESRKTETAYDFSNKNNVRRRTLITSSSRHIHSNKSTECISRNVFVQL